MAVQTCCRPLNDKKSATHFVRNILNIESGVELSKAVQKIYEVETLCQSVANKSTLRHEDYRDPEYSTEVSRKKLREQIFTELITNERLDDDEKIKLGLGGALPKDKIIKKDRQAFWVIGLPASGKSGISNRISDHFGAMILDSDYAKRKLPEFDDVCGAYLVHDESSSIVFGDEKVVKYSMLEYCCGIGANIVIPKIGHSIDSILPISQKLKEYGYDIHITLISLDRLMATQRAHRRFAETGRYVSLSLIFDGYANEPIIMYYRNRNHDIFKSFGEVSTENFPPQFVEGTPENPAYILYKL